MANAYTDTSLFDRAARFAIDAHANTERRGKGTPYVIHCMEAAAIVQTMTDDQEIMAAAILHDVIEDTEYTVEDICSRFGDRVAAMVVTETDVSLPPVLTEDPWIYKKMASIERLQEASLEEKMVALGDKLSNMRAIARDAEKQGPEFWSLFHNPDPKVHAWRYRNLAKALDELSEFDAYKEFAALIEKTFGPEK